MAQNKGSLVLKLTQEQQEEVRKAIGKTGDTLEMSIEELEARIAPARPLARGQGYHTP